MNNSSSSALVTSVPICSSGSKTLYPKALMRIFTLSTNSSMTATWDSFITVLRYVFLVSTIIALAASRDLNEPIFEISDECIVIPGEDSFRKLTDEELAEEQTDSEDMDEDSGPVMGM